MSGSNITVLGAGVIGLSLALELRRRGAYVTLYEARVAAAQASWAAAGMLAARDPYHPAQLAPLARLSAALYPAFLEELGERSGEPVPFQTDLTRQTMPDGRIVELKERSIDPRQLAVSLLTAVQRSGIRLVQRQTPSQPLTSTPDRRADIVVHATGAWAAVPAVSPRKGQMLRVRIPPGADLQVVHRSESVYVVPRTQGPQAGTALLGATVEDAGFNTDVDPNQLHRLRQLAAGFLAALGDSRQAPMVEAWAGLRPATPDGLPLLGSLPSPSPSPSEHDRIAPRHLIAAGHFRNGILLAPVTAVLIADLIEDRAPLLDLSPFLPGRFTRERGRTP